MDSPRRNSNCSASTCTQRRRGEMESRHNSLQAKTAGLNHKTQFAITALNAEIEQEGQQPLVRGWIVIFGRTFLTPAA